jgi:RimJ/RimL family protein N-acetyltransferase
MTAVAAAPAAAISPASSLAIETVRDRRGLRAFIRLPGRLYRGHRGFVAPLEMERLETLRRDRNPFFRHASAEYWIAYDHDRPVGRISAQIDDLSLERHGAALGHFGNLDAVDDPAVFAALAGTAAAWLKSRGMRRMRGPFGLSINEETGLMVGGFDEPPTMLMPYHPAYAGPHLEALGFAKAKDVVAYDLAVPEAAPAGVRRLTARAAQADRLRIRPIDMRRYGRELDALIEIFNDAWSDNWGFLPFTQAEAEHLSKSLRPLIDPELFWIAELDGAPVCMVVCLLNLCEAVAGLDGRLLPFGWAKLLWRLKVSGIRSARVPLMGLRRRLHGTAIGTAILYALLDALRGGMRRRGIERVELSWILEDNLPMRRLLESLGARLSKTYRIYDKDIP